MDYIKNKYNIEIAEHSSPENKEETEDRHKIDLSVHGSTINDDLSITISDDQCENIIWMNKEIAEKLIALIKLELDIN